MAIDLALTTGGERQSRSARSRSASVDTGEVTVSRREFDRPQLARSGGGSLDVAGALGSFFPGLIKEAGEEDIADVKRENAAEIARIEAAVRQDRDGAREAILSKDYSKFIPEDELRRRKVIQNSFQSMVAQQMAHQDFEDRLKPLIKSTPLGGDPDATTQDFLKANLEGADDIFARDYGRVISRLAAKESADFRESRLELQQAQAERQSVELIKNEIATNQVPATAEGLVAMRRKVIGALPMNAADAVTRADALVDSTLINMAAGGDALALRMAMIPDPNRDGTSTVTRNPGKFEEAVVKFVQRKNQVRSVAAFADLEDMEDRLSLIKAGEPAEGDNLQDLWADVWTHREDFGDSGAWDTLRNSLVTAMKTEGSQLGNFKMIARGLIPTMSNSDWNKTAEALWNGAGVEQMTAEGLDEQAAINRSMQALARRGSGVTLKDTNSARILGSGNDDEVSQTFVRLQSLDVASDRPMTGNHLSADAANLYHLMNWAQRSGKDPMAVRSQHLEALNADGDGGASPDTHFDNRQTNPGGKNSKTIGRSGTIREASKVWREIHREDLEVEGWISRNTFGLFGGDKNPSFDALAPVAQERLTRAVNQASFMLSTQNAGVDEIRALAVDLITGEFGLELGPDGKTSITLDQTPPIAVSQDGTPTPGERVTADVLKRAQVSMEDPQASAVVTAIGGLGGLGQDALTRAGHGLAVRSTGAGFAQDIHMTPGQRMMIPLSDLPPELPQTFFEEIQADAAADTLTLRVPEAPAPGENPRKYLTDSLFMLFDAETGAWTLRYQDQGATRMSLTELSEKNKAARLSDISVLDQVRPSRVRQGDPFAARAQMFAEVQAPVGSPVPDDDAPGPLSETELSSVRDVEKSAMETLQARGIVSGPVLLDTDDAMDVTAQTEQALMDEKSRGGWLDDTTKPINQRFLRQVSTLISEHEGSVPYVYDDRTGKAWTRSSKGNPTVGIGFSMDRPDARRLIKQVGGDFDQLMKDGDVLTDSQQQELLQLGMRESITWLRSQFKATNMPNHRWAALISLAYNSRWNDRGPTLIGPRITSAIKDRDWEAAANEIEFNSLGGVPTSLLPGIQARRSREADIFRGVFN